MNKVKFQESILGYCFYLLLLCLCTACATANEATDHLSLDLAGERTVYVDEQVRLSGLDISIRPQGRADFVPKVLFVPFRITQQMSDPGIAAYSISRTIFQSWNAMRIFQFMEFSGDTTPYRRDYALALGRARGADVVIGGFITRLYAGGSIGASELSVQVEAIDTVSGEILWSMAEAAYMPAVQEKDYILFSSKTRLPTDPIHAMSKSIGASMGIELQNWLHGAKVKSSFEKLDQEVKQSLFPKAGSIPPARLQEEDNESAF